MLTKNDLSQIREIVREEVISEVAPLKNDIGSLKQDVGSLRSDVDTLKKDVQTLKKDVKKIDKKLDQTIDFFDNEHLDLKKRVVRVETHLGLNPSI